MKQEIHDDIPRDEAHRFLLWLPEYDDTQRWAKWFASRGVPHMIDTDGHGKWTLFKHMPYGDVCGCLQKKGAADLRVEDLVGPSQAKKLAEVLAS